MTKTTTPTTNTGVVFSGEPRPLACNPLLFILFQPEKCTLYLTRKRQRASVVFSVRHLKLPLSLYLSLLLHWDNVFTASGKIWRTNPTDEREQCDDRWKKRRANTTWRGVFFVVVAAKQKAHSNVDPSLLWYCGQACWSSVCVCASCAD